MGVEVAMHFAAVFSAEFFK